MTLTNWIGLLALVIAAIAGVWRFGVYGGRMTKALEGVESAVKDFRNDFKESTERTGQEIDSLKQRTTKLESYLDVDGHFTNVLDMRRRRGGNEA